MKNHHNNRKNNIRLLKPKKFNQKFSLNNKEQKKLKVTYQNPKFYNHSISQMTENIEEYAHSRPQYLLKKLDLYNKIKLPLNPMSSEKNNNDNMEYPEKTFSYNKTSKNLTIIKKNLFRKSETFSNESNLGEKYINNEIENKLNDNINKNEISNSIKKFRLYTESNFDNSLNVHINNIYSNCNNSLSNTFNNTFSNNSNNNIINNININIKQSSYNINTITNFYQSLKHNFRRNKNVKIQHFSHSNIKSNNISEIKNKLHRKTRINKLKESIQLSQPKLQSKYNNFKPQKGSYYEEIKKKREMLKKVNSTCLSSPFRKNINKYEEKKNKSNNENKNSRKKIWSTEFRKNNISNYYKISSNKINTTKTIKSQSFSASKRNPKFRYKYIKNKVQMLSRNNFSKLEIFHTKTNSHISSKQIRRKSKLSNTNYDSISGAHHSIKVITDISQNSLPNISNLTSINKISNKRKYKDLKKQIIDSKYTRYINFGKNLLCKMEKKECNICHKYFDSHLFKIHYNSHPSQIFEWFYLGSFSNACDIKELRKNKINYILNCAIECHNKKLPKDIKELHLKIKDNENFDLINYFEEANEFINKCKLEGGTLLVHCKLGISRSASFVIAYLMENNNLSVEKALNFVKQKRNQIKPNEGFMSQLKRYERLIHFK